jgi:type IV pilus assembly protein PilY1
MGRDHKLYYEAYNDASDVDGDGVLDVGYKPAIDYYGYFDSYKCYTYSSTNERFEPSQVTADKTCNSTSEWSGDFLNYLTTSRMDAIRKVLYGGYRSTDTSTTTVLERTFIPQDAHSWGKEYTGISHDGYDIRKYTPFDLPIGRHLFASTNNDPTGPPLLRVLPNNSHRIWEWVSKERPVACSSDDPYGSCSCCETSSGLLYNDHPADAAEFEEVVQNYAIPGLLDGSGTPSPMKIDGSGNPYGDDSNYLTVFNGTIDVTTGGTYWFAVNGDDAVEVLVDGNVIVGWYGDHAETTAADAQSLHNASIALDAGTHSVEFRHEEKTGSDSYHLYWNGPDSGNAWEVVPSTAWTALTQSTYSFQGTASTVTDYSVRVQVCVAGMLEENCKTYPGSDVTNSSDDVYKPIGMLQKYGEADRMYFGLISGSYENNMSGGVLRKNISSIRDEVNNATGVFETSVNGIVTTINTFKIHDFDYNGFDYDGGWVTTRPMNEGEFPDWGNPIAEMMYEGLRYIAGTKTPTSDYVYSSSGSVDTSMGLPLASWDDPYDTFAYCSEPIMLVISDINPSYDTDQLPGIATEFGSWSSSSLGTLDVESLADTIFSNEHVNGTFFIGQSGATGDGSCSAKSVDGLGDVRGLCPEEPTKQGGYYAASVSYYGKQNDLNADTGDQSVTTYAVAMSSPLPRIEIPIGGQRVTLVPFAKSVKGSSISAAAGSFQPTNTIVDFYVETLTDTYGKFRINYEDVEQGADHDMDAIVIYEYQLVDDGDLPVSNASLGTKVSVTLTSEYAAGSIVQHMGYIISGTTADGTYLEVRDFDTTPANDVDYFLDTPTTPLAPVGNNTVWNDGQELPLTHTRYFSPSTTSAASFLNDPLWYAAKWGGFQDTNGNNIPDDNEWDRNGDNVPDTYFFVSNPGKLEEALNKAFAGILKRVSAGSAASVVSGSRSGEGGLYQAVFWPSKLDDDGNEITWIGDVHGFFVDNEGNLYADTNGNARFDSADQRVTVYLDAGSEKSKACVGGEVVNGTCTNGTVTELEDVDYLWSTANWLNKELQNPIGNRSLYNSVGKYRYLFTWFDSNLDGKVNDTTIDSSGEVVEFTAANMASLNATNVCNATVVKWIRGEDQTGMRSRKYRSESIDYYWRLGDVIYSTPTVVGRPAENYDLFWGDASYTAFYGKYRNRRNVVYFGGNDGILHAVNAGFYSASDKGFYKGYSSGTFTDSGMDLGAELWGYVPYNLLPHLKCLTRPDYKHKYYVDLHPRVFDVRIWESEYSDSTGTHPNGWGTILVCGMRFGGSHVAVDGRDFSSSYIIFDVTDPESPPVLLGEITYDYSDSSIAQLGYTQSVPSVVPVKNALGAQKWFLIMGSGPDAENINVTDAASTQKARLAVIPLNELARGDFSLQIPDAEPASDGTTAGVKTMSVSNSYVGSDFVAVDYDFDFYTDIFYYGLVSGETESWGGGVYRLKVEDKQNEANWGDPSKWGIHELIDTKAPVTGPVNLGWVDDQVWVYFGTGRFLTADDVRDTAPNYFFGIKEPKKTTGSAFNFNTVTINYKNPSFNNWVKANDILVGQNTGVLNCTDGSDTCLPLGVTTLNELAAYNMETPNGWFREFNATGERVIGQPTLLGGLVNFTSYIPDSNLCSSEGDSLFYALYYLTGTPWWQDVFGDQSPSDPYVQFTKSLGKGMSVTPSLHIGKQEGAKAFVQTSTGAIVEIHEPNLPIKNVKSGKSGWHTHDIE